MNASPIIALPDGTWIDNFRIVRRLGRGGFGVTYLAEEFREWEGSGNVGTPLRQVAIKEYFPRGLATRPDGSTVTLSPEVEGGEQAFQQALKGFFQEAESLMRFDHPNVIKIYRVFQRNGTAYFVMPFLKGETLKSILKREGGMGEERARRLLLPVLDGLIHAHAKGILHRDIKPDNVMVPDEGSPVLIDFGAARAQVIDEVSEYTRYSELVAYSPGYAALEQYGRATRDNPHGPHTDVYGLAAVLYHCVTGEAPPEASLRSMQLSNGGSDPLQPASARLMDSPGYGRAFLAAIDWGLELAGRSRPQSLSEFRKALDGKLAIPEATQIRLEQHGVSTEPYTRPAPSTRSADMQVARDTQRLTTPAELVGEETVLATRAPTMTATAASLTAAHETRSVAPEPVASSPDLVVEARPPRFSPGGNHQPEKRGGRALPLLGLLVAVVAFAYVLRDRLPESIRERLPGPLREFTAPDPSGVPVAVPEVAAPAEPTPAQATPPAAEPIAPPATAPAPAEDPKVAAERVAFEEASQIDTIEGWQAFRQAFPDSPRMATADSRIAALQPRPVTEVEPTPQAAPAPAPAPKLSRPAPPPAESPPAAVAPSAPARVAPEPAATAVAPKLLPGGFRDCPACPEMLRVPGGRFEMGDISGDGEADERPLREVTIAPFVAARYEVTFDEWNVCATAGACPARYEDAGFGRGRRPVIKVSWHDAQRYVLWLSQQTGKSYRLPSEAELEYLDRAGSRGAFPWGDDGAAACAYANVADRQAKQRNADWSTFPCDDGQAGTAPVGSFRPNALGLFDVAGNVWEWTQDCYQSYRQATNDGRAYSPPDCARRVVRGGSWSDAPRNLRSADRTASAPGSRLNIVGFRVARD